MQKLGPDIGIKIRPIFPKLASKKQQQFLVKINIFKIVQESPNIWAHFYKKICL